MIAIDTCYKCRNPVGTCRCCGGCGAPVSRPGDACATCAQEEADYAAPTHYGGGGGQMNTLHTTHGSASITSRSDIAKTPDLLTCEVCGHGCASVRCIDSTRADRSAGIGFQACGTCCNRLAFHLLAHGAQ